MSESYFCYGTTLSNLANIESLISTPPGIAQSQGGSPMPLTGGVARKLLSKRLKRSGDAISAWVWGAFDDGMSELNTLRLSVFGSLTTVSKRLYVITRDEAGYWSPFLCDVHCPYIGQSMNQFNNQPRDVRFDLVGGVLQSLTKTGNYTVTTADHLIYCDTSGGNITLALSAISGFSSDVPYRFVKTSASNTLTIDPNSSETIDGASTKAITAVGSTTIIKSGSGWISI